MGDQPFWSYGMHLGVNNPKFLEYTQRREKKRLDIEGNL